MASVELLALRARIDELALRFVDFDIPLDRDPTSDELDRIAAFKLLVHAEFENFIESRIGVTITHAVERWKTQRSAGRALLLLLLRWGQPNECPLSSGVTNAAFDAYVERCANRAHEELSSNNGIKQDALQRMSCSAGFLVDDLQPTLTGAATAYGNDRGDVAHQPVGKVRSLTDPRAEAANAKALVAELEVFDDQLGSHI